MLLKPNNNESKLILSTFEVSLTTYTHTKPKTGIQTLYAQTNLGKADEDKQLIAALPPSVMSSQQRLFLFRLFSPQTVTIVRRVLYRVIVFLTNIFCHFLLLFQSACRHVLTALRFVW